MVEDLVCPFCGDLGFRANRASGDVVDRDAIVCLSCGGRHDTIAGAPYPGGFDASDFLDVVSVMTCRQEPFSVATIRSMNGAFGQALSTQDGESAFASLRGEVDRGVLAANFSNWRHFNAMLGGESLEGAAVLALASGIGLDAVRVLDVGADVTFLEASPTLLAARRRMDPERRWVGGLPHRIPFDDETFDLVCYDGLAGPPSARALQDIVRTLKVGGRLFLTGVAFCAPVVDGDRPEGLTTFAALFDAFQAIRAVSITALIAQSAALDRLAGASALGSNFSDSWIPAWDENFDILRQVASLSSFVVVRVAGASPVFRTISPLSIRPGMVASWSHDKVTGFDRLMTWAPESLTLFQPRRPLATSPRCPGDFVLARWLEAVDASSPPLALEVTCDVVGELDVVVNGRLESTILLNEDGTGHVVFAPRETSGHVLIELRHPNAAQAGGPPPSVAIRVGSPA